MSVRWLFGAGVSLGAVGATRSGRRHWPCVGARRTGACVDVTGVWWTSGRRAGAGEELCGGWMEESTRCSGSGEGSQD